MADVKVVDPGDDILMISDDGTIIRMAADGISVYSRSTQGVRLMRLQEGSRVISIARTDKEETEEPEETDTSPVEVPAGEPAEETGGEA